jgi:hypothetical protein
MPISRGLGLHEFTVISSLARRDSLIVAIAIHTVIFAPLAFYMERGWVEDEVAGNIRAASHIRRLGVRITVHPHHSSPAGAD